MTIPEWFPSNKIPELRRYVEFHKMAEGSYGEIFIARYEDETNSRQVIVKRLKPAYAADDGLPRKAFLNEARILKDLHHPQIPQYLDGFASSRECFFIMKYMQGIPLARMLRNSFLAKKPISRRLSFHIVVGLLEILEYLHSIPIIHSDIKPENILVSEELKCMLLDFSMALSPETTDLFLGGTKRYLPPEYFLQKKPSPQSDLFMVAALWFDLLALRPLHQEIRSDYDIFMRLLSGDHLKTVEKQGFEKNLEMILLRALSYQSESRYESARSFREEIQKCARELGYLPENPAQLQQEWTILGKRPGL